MPYQIYGEVINSENGTPLAGERIVASENGKTLASAVSNAQGMYGIAPDLLIIPDNSDDLSGAIITFTVNGQKVPQTADFEPGGLTNLNLVATINSPVTIMPFETNPPEPIIATSNTKVVAKTLPNSQLVALAESTNSSKAVTSAIKYRGDIFHLNKAHAAEYHSINPCYRDHTRILGTSAGILVIILLSWVYLQNYLHYRRKSKL